MINHLNLPLAPHFSSPSTGEEKWGGSEPPKNYKIQGERVYLPNVKDPVVLKQGSKPDLLLRKIRDEVHRFAISYHRKVKAKSDFTSALDEIPGIGPKLRKTLLERFGSIEGIRAASIEELEKTPGMSRRVAERVKEG